MHYGLSMHKCGQYMIIIGDNSDTADPKVPRVRRIMLPPGVLGSGGGG